MNQLVVNGWIQRDDRNKNFAFNIVRNECTRSAISGAYIFFKFQELFLSGWSTTLPFCLVQWFAYESFVGCIRTGIREPISACIVCVETKKDAISGLVVGRIVIWRLARNPVGVFEWLEWFVCSPFPSFIAYLGIAARCPITVGVICQLWNSFWNRLLKEKPLER